MLDLSKINAAALKEMGIDGAEKSIAELKAMTPREFFTAYCEYEGLINWGNSLFTLVTQLQAAEVPAAPKFVTTYFVLNGLLNGEDGVRAIPAGGGNDKPQADGWYYLYEGDADGEGPFESRDEARTLGLAALEVAQSEG